MRTGNDPDDAVRSLSFRKPPRFNVPLSQYTSFKIGGAANCVCFPSTVSELSALRTVISMHSMPYIVLGKGSNTIFTDDGFDGCLIIPDGDFKSLSLIDATTIKAGSGCMNMALAVFARKHNLRGAEFLSTIPGTVGGAVFMNAGAYGSEVKDIVSKSDVWSTCGAPTELSLAGHDFSYRSSVFHRQPLTILFTYFRLAAGNHIAIQATENKMKRDRKNNQPINKLTWGSVFKNPPHQSAGELIEACGLKGSGFGTAVISQKHANFIENSDGTATFDDTLKTIRLAKYAVKKQFNISLSTEVLIYNRHGKIMSV